MKKRKIAHIVTTHRDCGVCPQCGYHPDCHTSAPLFLKHMLPKDQPDETGRGDAPTPGTWSVCGDCATILRFDDNVRLRRALPHELLTVKGECHAFFLGLMDVVDMVKRRKSRDFPTWATKFT